MLDTIKEGLKAITDTRYELPSRIVIPHRWIIAPLWKGGTCQQGKTTNLILRCRRQILTSLQLSVERLEIYRLVGKAEALIPASL